MNEGGAPTKGAAPPLDALVDALAHASVGTLSARVRVPENADPEHPYTTLAFAINILLSDLEHRERERERARHELERSEERHRRLVESMQDPVIVTDTERRILSVNPAFSRVFGYAPDELQGASVRALFANPGDFEPIGVELTDHARDGKPFRRELTWRAKDGRRVLVEVAISALVGEGQEVAGFMGVVRDVTEQRRTEDALKAAYDEMERRVRERTRELANANRELEAFNYMVAHDLKAPVRAVEHLAEALAEDYGNVLDRDGRDMTRKLRTSATRMRDLVEDMLTLSQTSRGDVEARDVDVGALAKEAFARARSREGAERDVEFTVAGDLRAHADPRLTAIALDNLIGNALKFTRNEPVARITLGRMPSSREDVCTFFVRDNGVGFDPTRVDRMFTAFQRFHAPHAFEGTGIGLAIVARVIERQGGTVSAEGRPGEGATFYFTLPAPSDGAP